MRKWFSIMLLIVLGARVGAQNFSGSMLSCTHLCTDVGDLDGDGDTDIATGGMRQLSWEENIGNNSFVNHVIAHNQKEV
jgi:hypothetical protein